MKKMEHKFKISAIVVLILLWPVICLAKHGDDLNFFGDEICSMEFRDADVKNVLRGLCKPYKINLLTSKNVKGTITASFKDVSAKNVFLAVLKDISLDYILQGNILYIDTFSSMESKKKLAPLVTKSIQVTYAFDSTNTQDLTDMANELRKMLSGRRGSEISVIPRTNTLLITDIDGYVDRILKMVTMLDQESPQVVIMAKIVAMDIDYSRELGIEWSGQLATAQNQAGEDSFILKSGVNLASTSFGNLNLLLGKISSELLDANLTAMENNSRGNILSNPKVITQNNQEAEIESGVEIPYQVLMEGGAFKIQFKKAVISLKVTPHVIAENVFMDLIINKDAPGTMRTGMQAIPIDTNRLTTKVLVENGNTVVIGGLIEQSKTNTVDSVPFFSELPLLGWLFKRSTDSKQKSELVIFITPSIIKRG